MLLSEFLDDALRILQSNLQIIASAPLQIYSSALLFAPRKSIIKNLFKERIPQWISLEPKVESNWNQCIRTLEGHYGGVTSVAFSPNSSLIASASADETIRLWDVNTGKCIDVFDGHNETVSSVAFSHDSLSVLSGSHDKTIRLWCIDTGECVQTLEGHNYPILSVAFSHDSSLIASASSDNVIRLWRVDTSECVHILGMAQDDDQDQTSFIAFSHDSSLLASGLGDRIAQLWDTNTGTCVQMLPSYEAPESQDYGASLAFSHDLSLVASTLDQIVRVWHADTGECVQEFHGHRNDVFSVAFSHDSSLIVSASGDYTIRLCNINTGDIQEFKGHSNDVTSVAFSHDSSIIASGSYDQTIRLWYPKINNYIQESDCYGNKTIALRRAGSSHDDMPEIRGHSECVDCVAFSNDSSLVASLSYDHSIRIWHADTGDCIRELRGWSDPRPSPQQQTLPFNFSNFIFSHDSSYVAFVIASEATFWLWSVDTGECVHEFTCDEGVNSLAFSPDSSLIASASGENVVLWSVDTSDCVSEFMHQETIIALAFSHNSSLIASASDETIHLWTVDTGECIRTVENCLESVSVLAFSHDSSLIASSFGNIIWLWRVNTGERVHELHANEGHQIDKMSFTSDGLHLVTNIGTIRLPDGDHNVCFDGYGFNGDYSWITWNGNNLIWLPVEYRPYFSCSAANKAALAVGCVSGRVWIMKFSEYPHGNIEM